MNFNEYLDDILNDVNNKKIDLVMSKLDTKVKTNFTNENKNKILKISEYLINNDLTVYDDEPLLNITNMLDDIKTDNSYFYIGSIYYDMALKNQSINYFKLAIKNLLKCEGTDEINKLISDSYFYIFILSKEEETNILDLKKAKKYLKLSNHTEGVEYFKIEFNFCGYYLKYSEFKKAIGHGLKALKFKQDSECSYLLPELYCFIGLSYIKLENYKKSIKFYKEAIDLIYSSKEIDTSLLKEALFNLAENYNCIKNYSKELKTRIALKHVLDESDEEDLELIYVNSKELAYIEKFNNQLSYAIKDAKTSLKLARKLNVSLDRLYENILLVAYVYYDLSNDELYVKYLKDSIQTAKLINDEGIRFHLLTNSLNELSTFLFVSGDDECIKYYQELKEEYDNKKDSLNRKEITDYVEATLSFAKVLSSKNEFSDVIYLLESIKDFVARKTKNDESFYYELSMIYNRLGIIYSEMNEMQKTIDYFILAINTFKKTKTNDNAIVLEPYYTNLIGAYEDLKEYELAIDALNKKLEMIDVMYNGRDIADYLNAKLDVIFSIAHEYRELDDSDNYKKKLEEIIEIIDNNIDIKDFNLIVKLATAYDEYGNLLTLNSDDDILAISYFKKAKEIYKQLIKHDNSFAYNIIYTNNSIAYCYQIIPNNEEAEKYYLESIYLINNYKKKYEMYDSFAYGIALRGLALLYDQEEDIIKAEKYYLEAIDVFEEIVKTSTDVDNHILIALYNNIIKFYDHIMKQEKGKKFENKLKKLTK